MNQNNFDFKLEKLLGKGAFGEVYLATKLDTNKIYAIKQLDRKKMESSGKLDHLVNEVTILSSVNHPNILKFDSWAMSENHFYIATEYINGDDLSECLKKYMEKFNTPFTEEITQHLMKQILEALNYLHFKKIAHRDLKLENIMVNFDTLEDKEELNMLKTKIKIIDFGVAKNFNDNNLLKSIVGTLINADPKIVKYIGKKLLDNQNEEPKGYNEKCDIWSIGTVCFELITGKKVFDVKTFDELLEKINEGKIEIPQAFSKEITSFLNSMLQIDDKKRSSAQELLYNDFIIKDAKEFSYIKKEFEHIEEREVQYNNISDNFKNNNIRNDNRSEDNVYKNIEEYKKLCGFSEQSYYGQSMSQKIQVISKKI